MAHFRDEVLRALGREESMDILDEPWLLTNALSHLAKG